MADYFYLLVAEEPFASFVKDENRARNLAILSQLLNTFQAHYHFSVITFANREWLRRQFFNSFLRLLHEGGINEYEDPDQPFPKGYVQVMTIHQAKGLEFPVVAVGSLHVATSTGKGVDKVLGPFYQRPAIRAREPDHRLRSDATPLRRILSSSEDPGPHVHGAPEGLVRPHLGWTAAVAVRREGSP